MHTKVCCTVPAVLLLLTVSQVTVALKCLSCDDSPNPRDCSMVKDCASGQTCFTELVVTAIGTIRFKTGCRDANTCGSATVDAGGAKVACSECCDTPICNVALCRQTGYGPMTSRGPVCYNCKSSPDPNQCDVIKVCGHAESCAITMQGTSRQGIYHQSCFSKSLCSIIYQAGVCTGCCDQDLCNNNCSATHQLPPPTTPPPTAASTTPVCVDHSNCAMLKASFAGINADVCSHADFSAKYCRKSCGLCGVSQSPAVVNNSNPCLHGAFHTTGMSYWCQCYPGYTGRNCDTDIDECTTNPCVHGSCGNFIGGYSCTCFQGYAGTHCEKDSNECTYHPCDHGSCTNTPGSYHCTCNHAYTGTNCDTVIPPAWTYYKHWEYYVVEEDRTWSEAKLHCESQRGYLADILSQEEEHFVCSLINKSTGLYFWLGGSDVVKEGEWKWLDGRRMNYTDWAPSEPNDLGNEDCAIVYKGPHCHWDDNPCSIRNPYWSICKRRKH